MGRFCWVARLALAGILGTEVLLPAAAAACAAADAAPSQHEEQNGEAGVNEEAQQGRLLAAVVGAAGRAALAALKDCRGGRNNARQPALVSALLPALLQPALFDCGSELTRYRRARLPIRSDFLKHPPRGSEERSARRLSACSSAMGVQSQQGCVSKYSIDLA
jgi:hypothetical protein